MRRLSIVCLVAGLLVASTISVSAQERSPAPLGVGQRFESEAAGHALVFPDDWTVWVPSEMEVETMLDLSEDAVGEQTADMARILVSMGMSYDVFGFNPATSVADLQTCFTLHVPNPAAVGLEDAVTMNMFSLGALPNLVGEPSSAMLDLPVGPVGRIDYVQRSATPDGGSVDQLVSMYVVVRTEDMHIIGCGAEDPPDDRWLPIAETFEFLPRK